MSTNEFAQALSTPTPDLRLGDRFIWLMMLEAAGSDGESRPVYTGSPHSTDNAVCKYTGASLLRYRKAIDRLIDVGYLEPTQRGLEIVVPGAGS